MLNLQEQVVSLELAKKMEELGFPQQNLFRWCVPKSGNIPTGQIQNWDSTTDKRFFNYFSAYTVGELAKLLPYYLDLKITAYLHMVKISPAEYRVAYVDDFGVAPYDGQRLQFAGGSLHNNLASMAIYLAEKGLITLEQRLEYCVDCDQLFSPNELIKECLCPWYSSSGKRIVTKSGIKKVEISGICKNCYAHHHKHEGDFI